MPRRISATGVLLVCLTVLGVAVGCETNRGSRADGAPQTTSESDNLTEPDRAEAVDLGDTFEVAAPWLPPDPDLVVIASNGGLDRVIESLFPAMPTVYDGPDVGTPSGLARDIAELFRRRFGLDPTSSRASIFAGGDETQSGVFLGDLDISDEAEEISVDGRTGYRVPVADTVTEHDELPGPLWAVSIDDPRPATAVFLTREALEAAVGRVDGDGDSTNTNHDAYRSLAEHLGRGGLFVALRGGPDSPLDQLFAGLGRPAPTAVGARLGSSLSVAFRDDPDQLETLEAFVDSNRETARQMLERARKRSQSEVPSRAVPLLVASHLGVATLEGLESSRSDGVLRYELTAPAAAKLQRLNGLVAAAVPLLFTQVRRGVKSSRQKNTVLQIRKLEQIVETYYLMEDGLPDDLEALTEGDDPFIENPEELRDPWDNKFIYEKKGDTEFEIYSPGPDGEPGTSDDIGVD